MYKKVCKQTIVSNIDIQSQQEIWFKWIEAQKAIIQKLQEPIEIIGKPEFKLTTLPYKDANGKPMTSYEVSINIKGFITKSEPSYLKGWDVVAEPNGLIDDKYD